MQQTDSPKRPDGDRLSGRGGGSLPAAAPSQDRLYFLDNLRVCLVTLVVLHHLAVTYSGLPIWYYVEPPTESWSAELLPLFVLFNQSFFMGLFFCIAGYFTPRSYDRKGAGAFLRDRLVRLGVPLLVFVTVLGPVSSLVLYRVEIVGRGVDLPYWIFYLLTLGPGPLWFLEALLAFTLLYVGWRRHTRTPADVGRRVTGARLPALGSVVAFTIGLAAACFVVRLWAPLGWYLPILGFPTVSHIAQYAALFVIGTIAYRRDWLTRIPESAGRIGVAAAVGASLTMWPLALTNWEAARGGMTWQAFTYALWESIVCVGLSLGLVTYFRRHVNGRGATWRPLSRHAYTVFVIHAPIITAVAYAGHDVNIDPLLKLVLASLIGVPLCYGAAVFVRSLPFADRIL